MSRNKRDFHEIKHQRYIQEGRGEGSDGDYKPWLRIHDIASAGNSYRLQSAWTHKHKREVHLFSQLELHWFYTFDWNPNITDIREQYSLPQEKTIPIAEQLGIKHPADPKTQYPIVMTSDFFLTRVENGQHSYSIRTIKYADASEKDRVQEKFQIEKAYWKLCNIDDWQVVTEEDLDRQLVRNVELLRGYVSIADRAYLTSNQFASICVELTEALATKSMYLIDATTDCDAKFNLSTGVSLAVAYYLIANRYWIVNMNAPIAPYHLYQLEGYSIDEYLQYHSQEGK